MSKNNQEVNRNWFFIILLTVSSLALAGTAAYFSIFGLSKLFYGAGLGIIILASVLEFSKLVAVSYVYRYWGIINKWLRRYYIAGVIFIMLLTSLGIYGFLTSAYQNTANKVEIRDSQMKIAENKKTLFVAQLDRINQNIESSNNRINTITGVRNQQESRLNNLYENNRTTSARATENQISSSDDQIKILNQDITEKMREANSVNDSIAFYDQKIVELRASDVSSEVGPLQYLSNLTGWAMNKVVNVLVLLIIFVFDPMAITLLIGVNQLTMMEKSSSELSREKLKIPKLKDLFRRRKKEENQEQETVVEEVKKEEIPLIKEEIPPIKEEIETPIKTLSWNFVPKKEEEEEITEEIEESEKIEDLKKNDDIFQICPDGYEEEKINLEINRIQEGSRVYHDKFGHGKIIKFSTDKSRVFIQFNDGIKELSPEYANLKEIIFKEIKTNDAPNAVQYLIFQENDPEIQDFHVPRSEINDENSENANVNEEIIENVSQKKTSIFPKIWKGKKII